MDAEKKGEVIIYESQDGEASIDVRLENETVWLRQEQIAELFSRDRTVISKHINNIFKNKELDQEAMCKICTLQIQISQ